MNIERQRLTPEDRSSSILAAAVKLALRSGYQSLTRDNVADAAGTSVGLIYKYFAGMDALRDAVMAEAVANRHVSIIAQGLAAGNPIAVRAPGELRREAANTLA